jgi:VanZ family protein
MIKFIPAFTWACIVALLCLLPQSTFYSPVFLQKLPLDKFVHFGMFFILSFLVWRGVQSKFFIKPNIQIVYIFLVLVAYGGITELAQDLLTSTRHSEFLDFLADTAGVVLGFFLYLMIIKRKISVNKNYAKY